MTFLTQLAQELPALLEGDVWLPILGSPYFIPAVLSAIVLRAVIVIRKIKGPLNHFSVVQVLALMVPLVMANFPASEGWWASKGAFVVSAEAHLNWQHAEPADFTRRKLVKLYYRLQEDGKEGAVLLTAFEIAGLKRPEAELAASATLYQRHQAP